MDHITCLSSESERYAKREADPTISEPGTGYSSFKDKRKHYKSIRMFKGVKQSVTENQRRAYSVYQQWSS